MQSQALEAGSSPQLADPSSAGASKADDAASRKGEISTTASSVATSDGQLKGEDSMSDLSNISDLSDLSGDDELQHQLECSRRCE